MGEVIYLEEVKESRADTEYRRWAFFQDPLFYFEGLPDTRGEDTTTYSTD